MHYAHRRGFCGDAFVPHSLCKIVTRCGRACRRDGLWHRICLGNQCMARHYGRLLDGGAPGAFGHGAFSGLFHPLHQRIPYAIPPFRQTQGIGGVCHSRNGLAHLLYGHYYGRLAPFVPICGHSAYPLDWWHLGGHRVYGLPLCDGTDSRSHEFRARYGTKTRHGQGGGSHQGRHSL